MTVAAADLLEPSLDTRHPLRNEPVQARSTARLSALLDAAAAIVDEIGFERLTTAMVADRAGASIGTVYRYFPDRIALLQALASRNLERVLERATSEIADARHASWSDAVSAALAVLVDAFRSEPGYRGLRTGDVIDLRPAVTERTYNSVMSDHLFDALAQRFRLDDDTQSRFLFEAAFELADSLAARAFARDPQGDEAFLAARSEVVTSMLAPRFGTPSA